MTFGIQHSTATLSIQNNMGKAQSALTTAMDRLSSGLRINSGKDDAAGRALSNTMENRIKGLDQGNRNANDAISTVQIIEGGLTEIASMLTRMNELAIQSSSGTYTDDQRGKMNVEFKGLRDEIARVSENAGFNGSKVMDGNASSMRVQLQAGGASGSSMSISLPNASLAGLSLTTSEVDSVANAGASIDSLTTALSAVTSALARSGADHSKLESAINNNTIQNDSLELAKGRIMDADFAKESAALAKNTVLVQMGQAMLSKANEATESVLSLLR
jgi:flagellin